MAVPRSHHLFKSSSRPTSFLWIWNIPQFPPASMGNEDPSSVLYTAPSPSSFLTTLLLPRAQTLKSLPLQCATQCPGTFSRFSSVWWTDIFLKTLDKQTSECPDHPRKVNWEWDKCLTRLGMRMQRTLQHCIWFLVPWHIRLKTFQMSSSVTPLQSAPDPFPLHPDLQPPCRCYSGGMNGERKACMLLFINILNIRLFK